ncbi:MAG: MlaD family protein [Verrucomicrobiota bacterium]|nr:MCE family protein [Verrucomicrobiota bacterium]
MSKKANPTSIGLFIFVGLGLGVAGVLLFSSSRLFTRTAERVLYFNSSLNGLNEGAPVKYRGVTIGAVKKVMIRFNQATNDYTMPVIIELQENLVRERIESPGQLLELGRLEENVHRGLRASLEAESLVTGVLYVGLDIVENAAPPVLHQLKPIYLEIPTQPTEVQALLKNLASFDLKGLEQKVGALIGTIETAVVDLQARQLSGAITNLLTSLNRVVSSPELTNALASLDTTLEQYRVLGEKLNHRVDPLADGVTNTLAQANQTLAQIRGVVQNLRALLAPDSALRNDLTVALDQLAGAAQSIAALAEFLQSHPNALITGRPPPKKP